MPGDVMVLQNEIDPDGMRRIHLMSNSPMGEPWTAQIPPGAQVKQYQDEIKLHHLEAAWWVRGDLVKFGQRFECLASCPVCHGSGCTWQRLVALLYLENGERISWAIGEAAMAYALATGQDPVFAWVRSLPKGVEWGAEVKVGGSIIVNLYSAGWMPDRAVAVGRGN